MGKKGTKRKTKWRALPLGEETAGSGNEEDLHDEDQSTASSIVGVQLNSNGLRRQPFYSKMADKAYRQTRRFAYDRFRSKEPLVKLESKTFDEEEYTKITTPRQDVLFKKGYFGRKRESSVEETSPPTGEVDGEEPLMDQIIITNGFVDERGHYLVNGNSYEIYDPYSNTVTVVVGPPPYANGVTHPVLAAVSCQPVPLQPVDWYPPGADWPSQGSAWTPSYPRNPPSDSLTGPEGAPNFPSPDAQPPHPYDHPAFLVPAYLYNESSLYNGAPLHANLPAEAHGAEEKETGRKTPECAAEDSVTEDQTESKPADVPPTEFVAEEKPEAVATPSPSSPAQSQNVSSVPSTPEQSQFLPREVHKQSHSTQTNLLDDPIPFLATRHSGKESHGTQTPSEEVLRSGVADAEARPKCDRAPADIPLPSLAKRQGDTKPAWKGHPSRAGESPKKAYQQRLSLAEKAASGPAKVSYARKAMSGKVANGAGGLRSPRQSSGAVANGVHQEEVGSCGRRTSGGKQTGGWGERRNGFIKGTCSRGGAGGAGGKERGWVKCKERRVYEGDVEGEGEMETEGRSESRSRSEKSSTISELSSPTELSSGENTPPEKLIVQKMEQEINKSFEVKLKQNLTKKEGEEKMEAEEEVEAEVEAGAEVKMAGEEEEGEGEEEEKEEEKEEEQAEEKRAEKGKGKKKKNRGKAEGEKPREGGKRSRRKKKRTGGERKEKGEADNGDEDLGFLSSLRERGMLFGRWEGFKDPGQDLMSEMGSLLNGDEDILKSLGIDGRMAYSKLPLHSDLLMILPTIGWTRPKLRIEDLFAPGPFDSDLFTKRNITSMKSTKPEEFFASVVDGPVVEKAEKKKEGGKKGPKTEETGAGAKKGGGGKREGRAGKGRGEMVGARGAVEEVEVGGENAGKGSGEEAGAGAGAGEGNGEGRLGIVEAVNTWLQEQGDSEKVLSIEGLETLLAEEGNGQKNGGGNPIHAPCADVGGGGPAEVRESGGCIRVANVINDSFVHVREEFPERSESGRMYRSSSWDAKLSDVKLGKHFKLLTDSASFCQDLISDVRNGLPLGNEYATEELCDSKQIVRKYYTLAPKPPLPPRTDSDSENEVFDALEYKFLPKDAHDATANGHASITDSGVHSDVELSEDAPTDHLRQKTCKLQ